MLAGKGFTLPRPRAVPSRISPLQLGQKVRLAHGLRPHLKASAARSSAVGADEIFTRKEELAALNRRFDAIPSELLILLGPANCGKTKLLQEVKKHRKSGRTVKGSAPLVLYLDCRGEDMTCPKGFANAIRELVTKNAGLRNWVEKVDIKFEFNGLEVTLADLFEPAAGKTPMASIIASLTKFLEATQRLTYKPVIIIDEANKLMRWSDDTDHRELKNLLDFFVRTTKQEHLGHVVLASSETFVIDFLESEGLNAKHYVTEEIGDLATMDEAKDFVESLMLSDKAPLSFFDKENGEEIDMWPRVYEICGGNIGLLERCATNAKSLGSWEAGLDCVSRDIKGAVKMGLSPGRYSKTASHSKAAWTKENYKTVLREIALAKEHKHAVSYDKLEVAVGEDALLSMVEWNRVTLRRKSRLAKDLPETVFTDLDDDNLVTMPSPVELYWVLKMYDAGKLDAAPEKSIVGKNDDVVA